MPNDFVSWLSGFVDAIGEEARPTTDQWAMIIERLSEENYNNAESENAWRRVYVGGTDEDDDE